MPMVVAVSVSSFAKPDATPLRLLQDAGVEVRHNPFGRRLTEDEAIEHLKGVDGLLAGLEPLNRKVLSSAPDLKAVARIGVGVSNVDFQAAADLGIKVSNTPEAPTAAVAELTLAALLALSRQLVKSNDELHSGRWTKLMGRSVFGLKVLCVGFGRIGRRVGELVHALGAQVLVHDPAVDAGALPHWAQAVKLDEGLGQADVVTLHASGERTILGHAELAALKEGAIILNSARGSLVDEEALVSALESGRLSGAWFDAFRQEPYEGPLTGFPQMLLTPHVGTYTAECRVLMETQAVNNLLTDLGLNG